MPMLCDGCENPSSVQHALDCRKGGLVIKRHNEIRDILGDICLLVTNNVVKEPIVRDASDTESGLIADLGIRGLWEPQVDALVDIRVVDTDARSYSNKSVQAVLSSAEQEKKLNTVMPPNSFGLPSLRLLFQSMVHLGVRLID